MHRTENRIALLRQALRSRDAWQVSAALRYVAEKLEPEHRAALVPDLVELCANPLWASDAREVLERI
ncbi:hypothetical protein ACFWN2_27995 [Lentzea sp. NPDC058436]|uniref:hypothetical protein n=1 Tax=Lentzea sp. NPDC058436 TaxID=3346499 RepID=UPI00365793F5